MSHLKTLYLSNNIDNAIVSQISALSCKSLSIRFINNTLLLQFDPNIIILDTQVENINEIIEDIKRYKKDTYIILLADFHKTIILESLNTFNIDFILNKNNLFQLSNIFEKIRNIIDRNKSIEIAEKRLKLSFLGESLNYIAHQWRQPLNIISSCTLNLKILNSSNNSIPKEKLSKCIENVSKQVHYLSSTIEDFRKFISESEDDIKYFHTKELFEQTINLCSSMLEKNFITIVKDIEDIELKGNKNLLVQAILNIIYNAKDALYDIDNSNRYIFISCKKIENILYINIKDSANGIDKSIIKKIFEEYFSTKSKNGKGTGIGLYLSKKIISEKYNGNIEVKNCKYTYNNQTFRGAKFIITIPLT